MHCKGKQLLHTFRTRALPMRRTESAGLWNKSRDIKSESNQSWSKSLTHPARMEKVLAGLGFTFIIRWRVNKILCFVSTLWQILYCRLELALNSHLWVRKVNVYSQSGYGLDLFFLFLFYFIYIFLYINKFYLF